MLRPLNKAVNVSLVRPQTNSARDVKGICKVSQGFHGALGVAVGDGTKRVHVYYPQRLDKDGSTI